MAEKEARSPARIDPFAERGVVRGAWEPTVEMKDGLLTIEIPKAKEAKPKAISIKQPWRGARSRRSSEEPRMNSYVYQWNLRPRPDICVELRIEAADAIEARREVVAFLRRHRAAGWEIEAISRSRGGAAAVAGGVRALPSHV